METTRALQPIPLDAVRSWHDTHASADAESDMDAPTNDGDAAPKPIIAIDASLNRKIALWNGAIWRLQLDAIANSTNEQLKDTSGLCRKILDAAGKEIWVECEAAGGCRTGEAVITRGCQLPARFIIHTVGPRYNIKYVNAAENALHMCYRSTLSVAKEEHIRTLALPCVYTKRKGYPRDDAAHVAARTVRRFLEHYSSDFDLIVFCVDSLEDQMIYESVLPLYFPRTRDDERKQATRLATRDLGDAFGEPIIEERKIRIQSFRGRSSNNQTAADDDDDGDNNDDSTDDEETAIQDFREMSIDPDTERLERLRLRQSEREKRAIAAAKTAPALLTYQSALSKARDEDFADLRRLRFLYNAGVDRSGAPVIVYEAAKLRVDSVDLDRVALFVIQTMDAVVEHKYSVLYVHAGATDENQPTGAWLKRLVRIFSSKYQTNLGLFYILAPTLWLKLLLFVAKGFVSRAFYRKIVYLASSKEIDHFADALALPSHIYTPPPATSATTTPAADSQDSAVVRANQREAVL